MDKSQEKEIFDRVFKFPNTIKVYSSESPDFVCRDGKKTVLGVEVTELYQHESHARLKKVDGYPEKLLNKEEYLHKDDIALFPVKDATLIKGDSSEEYKTKAIVIEMPSFQDRVTLLQKTIQEKNSKISYYLEQSINIDLIISDASYLFQHENFSDVYNSISYLVDKHSIYNSGFREVWILTTTKENNPTYFPLKLNLIAEEILIFHRLLKEEKIENPDILFGALILGLIKSGLDHFLTIDVEKTHVSLIFGCWVYRFTEDGVNIRDYSNIPYDIPAGKKVSDALSKGDELEIAENVSDKLIREKKDIEYGYCPNFYFVANV